MSNNKNLSLDDMFSADDMQYKTIDPPDWGGSITIKCLTVGQFAKVQNESEEYQAGLALAYCLVNPETKDPMVTIDRQAEAIESFSAKSSYTMQFIFSEIAKMNSTGKKPPKPKKGDKEGKKP